MPVYGVLPAVEMDVQFALNGILRARDLSDRRGAGRGGRRGRRGGFRAPSPRVRTVIQHFAAGIVAAAAAVELLPDAISKHSPLASN